MVDGDAVSGFVFRHADGSEYGARPTPTTSEVFAKAFAGLTRRGFPVKDVKPVLEGMRSHTGQGASVQDVVRVALRELTPGW